MHHETCCNTHYFAPCVLLVLYSILSFVFIIVVESPPPPMNLTISTNVLTSNFTFLNITWKSGSELRTYFVVHIIDDSTSDQIAQFNTTETQVQYSLSELQSEYNIDCSSLPSIMFSVSAVYMWSVDVSCASKESEAEGIPDASIVIQDCMDTGIIMNLICFSAVLTDNVTFRYYWYYYEIYRE